MPRSRLTRALDRAACPGVILVCAPAGSGKTALLAEWARGRAEPVAWLSLDAGDNDPARFWRHVVAALDRSRKGLAERLGPLLGPPAPVSLEGLVTALINELADQPEEEQDLLVLDDYHLISSQPVHASVAFLVEHLPPGLRLVLAGRADPPLPLARLRVRRQLMELRGADLRFTVDEAAEWFRQAGLPLPATAADTLVARTEGWAAGLQLAGLSLREHPDVAAFVASFSGSHRYVLDYLADEVLERQPEHVHDFLQDTSVLERLSGQLCDAVTGGTGGQQMLEQIERSGLFLVPLDEAREWWRYHRLFADLLGARMQQQQPDRVPELHRRAAAWHEEHGLADDAVRHALAAGDDTWAARLIEQHFDAVFYLRGEGPTVQRWLTEVPPELVASRPRLLLAQARLALLHSRLEDAERLLDSAERVVSAAEAGFEPSAGRAASLLINVPAAIWLLRVYLAELRGDADDTVAFASRAKAEIVGGESMLEAITGWYLGMADWLRGRLPEAERALSPTIARQREVGEGFLAAWGCHVLGQVQRAQGRLEAALGTYHQTLEVTALPGRSASPAAGAAHVGIAEVAYQRGQLDLAIRHVTEGIALCRQLSYTQPLAAGLATLAWIRQAAADPSGATEAMAEAATVAPGPGASGLLNPVPTQRARLLLAQGDVTAAASWADERGLVANAESAYPQEPEYLVLVRILIAQQSPDQALAVLERLRTAAADQGRAGSLIEINALRALALVARGEPVAALRSLTEAVTLAAPQGHVRVFVDEGAPMGALISRLAAAHETASAGPDVVLSGYLRRLARAFSLADVAPPLGGAGPTTPRATPGLPEPLTARELEVLRLIAAGRSNLRIAHDLVVSLDTVKKHVSHVLAKLGAANRTEAVAHARSLRLIP